MTLLESLHFLSPAWLWLALLGVLPLVTRDQPAFAYPAIAVLPYDALSCWIAWLWRICGALAIAALSLALAGPYMGERQIEKVGKGAHIMVVLDRSASMNDDFAGRGSGKKVSKMEAARAVLKDFVRQGRDDMVGMVTFSTSPVFAAPLTTDREVVQAALDATEVGGMGFTAVARGLGMALDYFEGKPVTGARAILLVSDGGAHLDGKTQDMLRAMFKRHEATLYWIYLRSANGPSLDAPAEGENIDAYPEYALHRFFQTLNTGYHVYQADNPEAVREAAGDIARMKNKPMRHLETVARADISTWFYVMAWFCVSALLALQWTEVKQWRAA